MAAPIAFGWRSASPIGENRTRDGRTVGDRVIERVLPAASCHRVCLITPRRTASTRRACWTHTGAPPHFVSLHSSCLKYAKRTRQHYGGQRLCAALVRHYSKPDAGSGALITKPLTIMQSSGGAMRAAAAPRDPLIDSGRLRACGAVRSHAALHRAPDLRHVCRRRGRVFAQASSCS